MEVEDQLQNQLIEFLPKPLKFVKTEVINPLKSKNLTVNNRVDIEYEDVEDMMGWKSNTTQRNAGRGYINSHSNCYMISVLQVLTHSPPLFNYIQVQKLSIKNDIWNGLVKQLSVAFNNEKNPLTPLIFEKNLSKLSTSLRRYHQEDATEFYLCLLDYIHETLVGKGSNKRSAISSIFHSILSSRITCYNCMRHNDRDESFSIIPLELTKARTLQSSMDLFFKKEMLNGNNKYHCERCNTNSTASKCYYFKQVPWILSLQLKRFSWDGKKVNGFISFPLQLDVSKYGVDGIYDLFAIIVHAGRTKHSGHYYAFVKGPSGGWHLMDDDFVKPVTVKAVMKEHAYMVFYKKSMDVVKMKDSTKKVVERNDLEAIAELMEIENKKEDDNYVKSSLAGSCVESSLDGDSVNSKESLQLNQFQSKRVSSVQKLLLTTPVKRPIETPNKQPPLKKTTEEIKGFQLVKKEGTKTSSTQTVVKKKKDLPEMFDFRTTPLGLQYPERVESWDSTTDNKRKEMRGTVMEIDKGKQQEITKLDAYDIELDKPKQRKLRRNMKNRFQVTKGRNVFQAKADEKRRKSGKTKY